MLPSGPPQQRRRDSGKDFKPGAEFQRPRVLPGICLQPLPPAPFQGTSLYFLHSLLENSSSSMITNTLESPWWERIFIYVINRTLDRKVEPFYLNYLKKENNTGLTQSQTFREMVGLSWGKYIVLQDSMKQRCNVSVTILSILEIFKSHLNLSVPEGDSWAFSKQSCFVWHTQLGDIWPEVAGLWWWL